jgi:hypothetical protein
MYPLPRHAPHTRVGTGANTGRAGTMDGRAATKSAMEMQSRIIVSGSICDLLK